MKRAFTGAALASAALLLAAAPPSRAREARGVRAFAEFGYASFSESDRSSQAGLRVASMTPGRPSLDFTFAAWLLPAVIVTPDLDLAVPIALGPGVRLVPRAGVSGLLVGGGDVLFAGTGVNAGAGLVLNADGPVSVRADYTLRRYGGEELSDEGFMHVLTAGLSWGAHR